MIRRPSRGNFRTVVSCGFNLEDAALLEERRANGGRIIWCQMDVTSRYGKDPAATRLVDNILAEFAVRDPEQQAYDSKGKRRRGGIALLHVWCQPPSSASSSL